ncbi:hypothetical protein NDU88_007060 [Pleurodeles waltl]|uniref:Uncharacterized protein n=1 Tax=Pleurodeles waltl TaxID=8319 RepID=A0AAV7NAH1_PLEWA|nr:hypothetical protein NDU88_007060 [Pleurodeles waltl]
MVPGAQRTWAAGAVSPDRGAAGVAALECADLALLEALRPEDRRPGSQAGQKSGVRQSHGNLVSATNRPEALSYDEARRGAGS